MGLVRLKSPERPGGARHIVIVMRRHAAGSGTSGRFQLGAWLGACVIAGNPLPSPFHWRDMHSRAHPFRHRQCWNVQCTLERVVRALAPEDDPTSHPVLWPGASPSGILLQAVAQVQMEANLIEDKEILLGWKAVVDPNNSRLTTWVNGRNVCDFNGVLCSGTVQGSDRYVERV